MISMFSPNIRLKTIYIYIYLFDLKKPDPNKKNTPGLVFIIRWWNDFWLLGALMIGRRDSTFPCSSLTPYTSYVMYHIIPSISKKYLTILNHFFYTVSAPPQLFQSEPTSKRHCSTAQYQGPQVVGWFTKRSQHTGLTAGTSHLKNRMAINRWF